MLAGGPIFSDVTPLPTLGRYPAGLAPLRRSGLTLLLGRVGLDAFHVNGGHVPKPLFKARAVHQGVCSLAVVHGWQQQKATSSGRSCMSSGDNCRGTQHRNCRATPGSMYEPNQFVMNCGVIDPTAGPIRIYSPISRNLNDGDKISPSSVLLLMGRLQLSLSVCAMPSPSIRSR